MRIGNGTFLLGDCLEIMPTLAAGSVDMVLCDLPYGTTRNAWDSVLPLDVFWRETWRLAAERAGRRWICIERDAARLMGDGHGCA